MIYSAPALTGRDEQVLGQIEELRHELRFYLRAPRRWHGTLSRVAMARAVQASTAIEGYHSTVAETVAIIEGEHPASVGEDTRKAIVGYRNAMTYILQLTSGASPDPPRMDASLLKSLHFMMVGHDLSIHPGQWRPGAVWVRDGAGNPVYEAPPREAVEPLMTELTAHVSESAGGVSASAAHVSESAGGVSASAAHSVIGGAMAHLNLTLIHPFSDGNGRMARCLQSFVLACADSEISPVFASIEEYLGRNTGAYYRALTDTAACSWSPQRSARPWLEFCLTAHLRQAARLRIRIDHLEALWDRCQQAASHRGLPDRTVDALVHSARGWQLNRSLYISIVRSSAGEQISEAMATRDLAAMSSAGLLTPVGQKRGRHYLPSESLQAVEKEIRRSQPSRPEIDPYNPPA